MPAATVERRTLRKALDLVGTATPKRPGWLILGDVWLESDGTQMRMRTTDLDIEAEVTIPLTRATEPFVLCLPVRSLVDYVKRVQGSIIQIAPTADYGADILSDAATIHLSGSDPAEFPLLITARAGNDGWVYGSMDAQKFTEAFTRVAVVAARTPRSSLPILTAVDCRDGRLIGSDGFRAASEPCGYYTDHSLPIPSAFGRLLTKAAMGDAAQARYQVMGSGKDARATYLEVSKGPIRLACQLVDGHYPVIEHFLPETYNTVVRTELAGFVAAMEAGAAVTGREQHYAVAVTALPDRCVMVAKGEDGQAFRTEIPAGLDGSPIAVALNGRILAEMLRRFCGHWLTIGFSGIETAARFSCDADSLTCWQMPVFHCDWIEQPHADASS